MTEAPVPCSLRSTREATATREQLVRCNEGQPPLSATRGKPADKWKPSKAKKKEMKLYLKTKLGSTCPGLLAGARHVMRVSRVPCELISIEPLPLDELRGHRPAFLLHFSCSSDALAVLAVTPQACSCPAPESSPVPSPAQGPLTIRTGRKDMSRSLR